jgi:hypothetical protein
LLAQVAAVLPNPIFQLCRLTDKTRRSHHSRYSIIRNHMADAAEV